MTDTKPGRPRGPNAAPLLAELDPEGVARDVCQRVREHLASLAMRLDMAASWSFPEDAGALGLGPTVRALTLYAQRGLPVWDWTTSGMASDGCLEVFSALYTCAGSPALGGGITDLDDDVEPDDAIGVVLLAALARIRIDQRGTVAPRELAVLAGVTDHQVRHLIRAGEIRAKEDGRTFRVSAAEARRWLSARGVRGL